MKSEAAAGDSVAEAKAMLSTITVDSGIDFITAWQCDLAKEKES